MVLTRICLLMVCAVSLACGDDGLEAQSEQVGDATAASGRDDADAGPGDLPSARAGRPSQPASAGKGAGAAGKPAAAAKPQPAAAGAGVPPPPSAAGSSASVTTPPAAGAPSTSQPAAPSAPKPGDVETVAMDVVYISDLAGNVLPDPRPIILFKDGWATKDINYFVRGLDIPAHKMMYPKTWVEWQLVDDKLALKNSNGGFTKMTFQNRYEPNSASLTFEQKFTRLLTGVNVALGTSAVVQKDIQFWNDHRVVVGSYTGVITPITVTQVVPPESRGTYQIDGYTIELKWDDGTTKKTSFVWSDEDPEAVYIDGLAYIVFN